MSEKEQFANWLKTSGIVPDAINIEHFDNPHEGIIRSLAKAKIVDEEIAYQKISNELHVPFVDLSSPEISRQLNIDEFKEKIDESLCWKERLIPLYRSEFAVVIACSNPFIVETKKVIEFSLGSPVQLALAKEAQILQLLERYLTSPKKVYESIADFEEADVIEFIARQDEETSLDESDVETPPVVRLCNTILSDAIKQKASDIHFEPGQDGVSIRFRIDGVMKHIFEMPQRLQAHVCTRFKILSGMDISEKRRPQDGRMRLRHQSKVLDIRSSSIPTPYGEKIVMRLLGNENDGLELSQLLIPPTIEQQLKEDLNLNGKLILVTGPTGSGKTTTLYSSLKLLRNGTNNIQTVEDPIEYRLSGITQVQTNRAIDVTFASALRSVLRQDPDVIMIGEIRDEETAEIAFQAAHTGHQVLSTLHTNDAVATLLRLKKLGIDNFLMASCLQGIMAQRLVRKLCNNCKCEVENEEFEETAHVCAEYNIELNEKLYKSLGCEECHFSGYQGRIGVYSYLHINTEIEELIQNNADSFQIIETAKKYGYCSLSEAALQRVRDGYTSLEEVAPHLHPETGTEKETKVKNTSDSAAKEVFQEKKLNRKTLLLVEDDDSVRSILKLMLQKEMIDVVEAENGAEALEKLYEHLPDIILCDLMMPVMDGKEFLLRMKNDERTKDIPVVILTAADTEEKEIELLKLGASDFVSKTSSSDVMLTRLRRQIR